MNRLIKNIIRFICCYFVVLTSTVAQEISEPEPAETEASTTAPEEGFVEFRSQADLFSQAVFIYQLGDNNHTNVHQTGDNNIATIAISGDLNGQSVVGGKIIQEDATNDTSVVIVGNQNNFDISQKGDTGENSVELLQTGLGHSATLLQTANNFSANSANILQTGTGNAAKVTQLGTLVHYQNQVDLLQEGTGNTAIFNQDGGDNKIDASQSGDNLSAIFNQYGLGNEILSRQNGVNLNTDVTQYGGAKISIIQTNSISND